LNGGDEVIIADVRGPNVDLVAQLLANLVTRSTEDRLVLRTPRLPAGAIADLVAQLWLDEGLDGSEFPIRSDSGTRE
jgi:hypothetical protein